jgi:hypothetical protein
MAKKIKQIIIALATEGSSDHRFLSRRCPYFFGEAVELFS